MPELSKDVVALLQYLAPGLLVAWVYFGITSDVKPSQFERVVQALIYTVVIQGLVAAERSIALSNLRNHPRPQHDQQAVQSAAASAIRRRLSASGEYQPSPAIFPPCDATATAEEKVMT